MAAAGGGDVRVEIDGSLQPTQLRVGSVVVDIGQKILLPGGSRADRLFLDDARNAPRLGVNIRNALGAQRPDLKDKLAALHKGWTRTFARKVMGWNHRLETSPLRGKRVADPNGRSALLTWAGATVDAGASNKGPAALARLPREPSAPELGAYISYIDSLVTAVV